uniref:ERAP1-like C-terminal domain-containing protein n=1 Tax=Rugamonas sp. TaxID=1926287 RepID=UPI0025DDD783
MANLPAEHDYTLLGDVLRKVESSKEYLDKMAPASAYNRKITAALEKITYAGMLANGADSNFQRSWFAAYLEVAGSKPALARLAAILDGKQKVPGLKVSRDQRWAIIATLNRQDHAGSAALIDAELARDKSDSGQAAAVGARAGRPDPAVKEQWLATIGDLQTKVPFSRVRKAMDNLYPARQTALGELTAAQRLAQLPVIDKVAGPVFMRSYGPAMIPGGCTPASVQRLADADAQDKELSAGARRALLVAHQEDARCVTIKQAMTVSLR